MAILNLQDFNINVMNNLHLLGIYLTGAVKDRNSHQNFFNRYKALIEIHSRKCALPRYNDTARKNWTQVCV